jgi:retinoblastoma-associated protein
VCAIESVFFISIVKHLQVHDILNYVDLKPFDFWRLLNSFLKFDPQMPRALNNHFREIEIRIVSEAAWQQGSPVVEIIKEICKSPETADNETKQE